MRKKLFTKKVLLVLIYISSVSILLNFQLINYNYLFNEFSFSIFCSCFHSSCRSDFYPLRTGGRGSQNRWSAELHELWWSSLYWEQPLFRSINNEELRRSTSCSLWLLQWQRFWYFLTFKVQPQVWLSPHVKALSFFWW